MSIKLIGAGFIILSCCMFGFLVGVTQRRQAALMREFICTIDYIIHDLQYRRSSFSDAFCQAAAFCGGIIGKFFDILSNELEKQVAPNMQICVDAALRQSKEIPGLVCHGIKLLGSTLGCFDLDGQIAELQKVREECEIVLRGFTNNQDVRIRNCQTLTLCAGAAIVIILI